MANKAKVWVEKNEKNEWCLFFSGWDTTKGHPIGECYEMVTTLTEALTTARSKKDLGNPDVPNLFDPEVKMPKLPKGPGNRTENISFQEIPDGRG